MKYIAVKKYEDAPSDPINLVKNQHVLIVEKSNPNGEWPNWIYCASDTKKGWVPKQILDIDADSGIVLNDYDATEFNLEVGEMIESTLRLNGWIWGYKVNEKTEFGWAPLNHLKLIK